MNRLAQKTTLAVLLAVQSINPVRNASADTGEQGNLGGLAAAPADIAADARGLQARKLAVGKLNADEHKAVLEEIAQDNNEDMSVRLVAFEKLHPGMEHDISIGDLDEQPRPQARLVARPKPTEEDIFRHKMQRGLPYSRGDIPEYHRLRTLGQLSKVCDYAVVGKAQPSDKNGNLVLDVEEVLLGDIPPKGFFKSRKIAVEGRWMEDEFYERVIRSGHPEFPYTWNLRKRPKPGDRVLAFLFDKRDYDALGEPGYSGNERHFDFRKKADQGQGMYHLSRGEGGGGIRCLDTPENTASYLSAVKGYLKELRGEGRDAESYYALLRTLVQSPIESIREDARSDLMYLIEYCPSFDAGRVLSDDRIDAAIKHWVEHDVIPGREKEE